MSFHSDHFGEPIARPVLDTQVVLAGSDMMQAKAPNGWGSDALTDFLTHFRGNQFATFANKGQAMADLVRIDAQYVKLAGTINPRPYYPMQFLLRAHSAYRAGMAVVMGGQQYEAQALLRLCLEHAAYGFYIGSDKNRCERWLRRGDSDANRKAVKDEFQIGKIKAHIRAQAATIEATFDHLYNRLIDLGAHPNEAGYSLNSTMSKTAEGDVHLQTIYLQGDGLSLDLGMKTAAQVGIWSLLVMQLLYREKFELLGIRAELDDLRQRY